MSLVSGWWGKLFRETPVRRDPKRARKNPTEAKVGDKIRHRGHVWTVKHVQDLGWVIIERNYRDRWGNLTSSGEQINLWNGRYWIKNPARTKIAKKFESCVKDVKKKGGAYSPYAACTTSMYKKYGKRKTKKALAPLRRRRRR